MLMSDSFAFSESFLELSFKHACFRLTDKLSIVARRQRESRLIKPFIIVAWECCMKLHLFRNHIRAIKTRFAIGDFSLGGLIALHSKAGQMIDQGSCGSTVSVSNRTVVI
jgi:hypothetical protein